VFVDFIAEAVAESYEVAFHRKYLALEVFLFERKGR